MGSRVIVTMVLAAVLPAAIQGTAPGVAATPAKPGLEVLAVRESSQDAVSLVLAMPPGAGTPTAVKAFAGGEQLVTGVEPVLSDRSAVALVLDASAAGARALNGGGSAGAANFLLRLPSGAATAVIADRRPPEVAATTSVGVTDDLLAISSLRTEGERATGDALALAVEQLAGGSGARPVIILYTSVSAPDGEPATALAQRLQVSGAIVAVVGAGADGPYWPTMARLTGGVAISAPAAGSVKAFDEVADILAGRFVVTVQHRPVGLTRLTLQLEVAGGPTVLDVDLAPLATAAAEPVAGDRQADDERQWVWLAGGLLVAGLLGAGVTAVARLRRRPPPEPAAASPTADPPQEASLFEKAVEQDRAGPDQRRELAAEYQRLAGRDRAEGRVALAASGYRQAVDLLAERVALEPGDLAHLHDLALAVTELAELDAEQGWIAQAEAGCRRAVEIGEALARSFPPDPAHRRALDQAKALAAALGSHPTTQAEVCGPSEPSS